MTEALFTPDLTSLLQSAMDARLQSVQVAFPARVQTYDAAKQAADVLPLTRGLIEDADGAQRFEDLPLLQRVPVLFPRSGNFALTFPIAEGDTLLVVCTTRDFSQWRRTGSVSNPEDVRAHSIANAVAIPGFYSAPNALPATSEDSIMLGHATGKQIHVQQNTVNLGSKEPTDAVAKASLVDDFQRKFFDMFSQWTTVPNDGGAALYAKFIEIFQAQPPPTTASSVVKTD